MTHSILLLGGLLIDRYLVTKNFPQRGQDTLIAEQFQRPGGCPYNVAKTLQSLGVTPLIWSAVSDDDLGRALWKTVAAENLPRTGLYNLPGGTTGFCMVILDDEGERTFMTYRGSEGHFDPECARLRPALRKPDLLYVTGIYLLYPEWSPAAVDFIEGLAADGVPVLFDPGPLAAEIDPSLLRRVTAAATYLTPSADEVTAVQSTLGIDDLPAWSFAHKAACLLETRGSQGAVLHTPAGKTCIAPYPARVVDTTGTGDSFAAGFIASVLTQGDLFTAARTASACGSLTAETIGPCRPITWEDIEARMTTG